MFSQYPGQGSSSRTASPPHSSVRKLSLQSYNLPPMISNMSVTWALSDPRNSHLTEDPEYIKAVFRSYIQVKRARGRTNEQIADKLNILEDQLPGYIIQWKQIRRENGLPASRTLPRWEARGITPLLPDRSDSRPSPARRLGDSRRHTTTSNSTRPPRQRSNSVPAVNAVREEEPIPPELLQRQPRNPEDEPPPPPYSRDDADPESTQILEQRLAAEAEANRSVPRDTPARATPPTRMEPPRTETPRISTPRIETPPRRSTERRRSSTSRHPATPQSPNAYAPPPGPPPGRGSAVSSRPDTPPDDPDLRRVWEESQFEEAKRASLAAQKEQDELEEAMRLSLADTGGRGASSSSANQSGSASRPPIATVWEDADDEDDVANSRRISSYQTTTLGTPQAQRRTVSDANLRRDELEATPDSFTIADGWQAMPSTSAQPSRVLQSNNPFLSRAERMAPQMDDLLGDEPSSPKNLLSPSRPLPRPSAFNAPSDPVERFAPPPGPPPHLAPLPPPPSQPNRLAGTFDTPVVPPLPPRKDTVKDPVPPLAPQPSRPAVPVPPKGEDPLQVLRQFKTVFLVDDSASIAGDRWSQAQRALTGVAEITAQYSDSGVDVHFLNSKRTGRELKTSEDLEDLFAGLQPKGSAPIAPRIDTVLRDCLNRLENATEVRAVALVIMTDGNFALQSPDPRPTQVESVLVSAAQRLDKGHIPPSKLRIQFMQIGNDGETREALQQLDDDLQSTHCRDMVDMVLGEDLSAGTVIKALLGGLDKGLDNQPSS